MVHASCIHHNLVHFFHRRSTPRMMESSLLGLFRTTIRSLFSIVSFGSAWQSICKTACKRASMLVSANLKGFKNLSFSVPVRNNKNIKQGRFSSWGLGWVHGGVMGFPWVFLRPMWSIFRSVKFLILLLHFASLAAECWCGFGNFDALCTSNGLSGDNAKSEGWNSCLN